MSHFEEHLEAVLCRHGCPHEETVGLCGASQLETWSFYVPYLGAVIDSGLHSLPVFCVGVSFGGR